MASIADKIAQIRQAILGKDVREALASGMEAINAETENTTQRQDYIENLVDEAEQVRQYAEEVRIENENERIYNENLRQSQETARQESIADIETRFNDLTTEQQQDAEVIDARKGEVSLRAKIDAMDNEVASHLSDFVALQEDFNVFALSYKHVKQYGAHSTSEPGYENFDSTSAIQAALDDPNVKCIDCQNGVYKFSKLTLSQSGKRILAYGATFIANGLNESHEVGAFEVTAGDNRILGATIYGNYKNAEYDSVFFVNPPPGGVQHLILRDVWINGHNNSILFGNNTTNIASENFFYNVRCWRTLNPLKINHQNMLLTCIGCYFDANAYEGTYTTPLTSAKIIDIVRGNLIFTAGELISTNNQDALGIHVQNGDVRIHETVIEITGTQAKIETGNLRISDNFDGYSSSGKPLFIISDTAQGVLHLDNVKFSRPTGNILAEVIQCNNTTYRCYITGDCEWTNIGPLLRNYSGTTPKLKGGRINFPFVQVLNYRSPNNVGSAGVESTINFTVNDMFTSSRFAPAYANGIFTVPGEGLKNAIIDIDITALATSAIKLYHNSNVIASVTSGTSLKQTIIIPKLAAGDTIKCTFIPVGSTNLSTLSNIKICGESNIDVTAGKWE